MGLPKPFKRTARPFVEKRSIIADYSYILHKDFANSPEHYVRAYLIIQKDFLDLLDYIEPAHTNLKTYSFRIHELLIRICIEIEANCTAILVENGYHITGNLTMKDYKKIDLSHKLSSYEVKLPIWDGDDNIRKPFINWKSNKRLGWWESYNKSKHDRHAQFRQATFENMIDAMCGLITIITAQFKGYDFAPADMIYCDGIDDGMDVAIGSYFKIKSPSDWTEDELYNFDWSILKNDHNSIAKYDYR